MLHAVWPFMPISWAGSDHVISGLTFCILRDFFAACHSVLLSDVDFMFVIPFSRHNNFRCGANDWWLQ